MNGAAATESAPRCRTVPHTTPAGKTRCARPPVLKHAPLRPTAPPPGVLPQADLFVTRRSTYPALLRRCTRLFFGATKRATSLSNTTIFSLPQTRFTFFHIRFSRVLCHRFSFLNKLLPGHPAQAVPGLALHALGAAIPVAVSVACALQERFRVALAVTTSTETVLDEAAPVLDADAEDLSDDADIAGGAAAAAPALRTRAVSAIHITVTRAEMPAPL